MDKITSAMIKHMANEFGKAKFLDWSIDKEITRLIWNEWIRRYKDESESLWDKLKREIDNDSVQALVTLFNNMPGDFDTWEEIKNEPYG